MKHQQNETNLFSKLICTYTYQFVSLLYPLMCPNLSLTRNDMKAKKKCIEKSKYLRQKKQIKNKWITRGKNKKRTCMTFHAKGGNNLSSLVLLNWTTSYEYEISFILHASWSFTCWLYICARESLNFAISSKFNWLSQEPLHQY